MIRKILALSLVSIAFVGIPASGHGETHVQFSCTVDYGTGISGVGSVGYEGSPAGNFGSCEVATLQTERVIWSFEHPEDCTINHDANDDGFTDTPIVANETYPSNTTFTAFCEANTFGAVNNITAHHPADPIFDEQNATGEQNATA